MILAIIGAGRIGLAINDLLEDDLISNCAILGLRQKLMELTYQ